jgi:hypothetical protein
MKEGETIAPSLGHSDPPPSVLPLARAEAQGPCPSPEKGAEARRLTEFRVSDFPLTAVHDRMAQDFLS